MNDDGPSPGLAALGEEWAPTVRLGDVKLTRRTNHKGYGTVSRYRVITDDGVQRQIIHGQSTARRRAGPIPLTLGTAPPLSLGPEGLTMHTLMKAMAVGIDAVVFGPERSQRGVDDTEEVRLLAKQMSFARTAHVSHLVCDHLASTAGADLRHMLWTGVSLGAMKGITFAAFAPLHERTLVYSQFVVPACPYPQTPPSRKDLRRYQRSEMGAMLRQSSELMAHDMRKRMFRLNTNVARSLRPGLSMRYAQAFPRDSVSAIFTEGWRDAVCTGDAGIAATHLPADRLATFDLFDRDRAGSVEDWSTRLRGVLSDRIRVVIRHGRHTDAMRLSHQNDRAKHIGKVLAQLRRGVQVEDLTHPYA